jgi:hypothetical protein
MSGELPDRKNIRMKPNQTKHAADAKLKNGVFQEHYKDCTQACVGKYRRESW